MFLIAFISPFSFGAKYNGDIEFSQQEISYHQQNIGALIESAKNCLEGFEETHFDFYENNSRVVNGKRVHLSKYYGARRYSDKPGQVRPDGYKLTWLVDALAEIGFPASDMAKMEPNSCVGMALTCLEEGFKDTNQSAQWVKIRKFTNANGVGGVALQYALRQIGWTLYYWNPSASTESMAKWDQEESSWASRGQHLPWYNSVKKKGKYWANTVDNSTDLVGFGDQEPEVLKDQPFWVGTANVGYHVFPGTYGKVVEAHSTRHITAIDNLEVSMFNPFANGGGPRWTPKEKYRSGLIALPPAQ